MTHRGLFYNTLNQLLKMMENCKRKAICQGSAFDAPLAALVLTNML